MIADDADAQAVARMNAMNALCRDTMGELAALVARGSVGHLRHGDDLVAAEATAAESAAWLAAGELDVEAKPGDWLSRKIVDIKEDDVLSITVRHPDGEEIKVSKPNAKDRYFTLHGIPDGKKLEYDSDPNNIAAVIEQLDLDDARKAGFLKFDAANTTAAEFITRDGLRIDIRMVEKGEVQWIDLKASALADAPAPVKDQKPAAERATEINQRVSGWVYALPGFKGSRLKRRMADMLKDKKPAS